MLSNDVPESGSVDALLLTPKARVIAPLLVWRRGSDDVLLLTEPELGETVRAQLARMRFAAKCEIEIEEHTSTIVLDHDHSGGGDGVAFRIATYGVPAREVLDSALEGDADLERLRIEAATPRFGRGDRRPRPARGSGPRRARDLVQQGLLSRPGADRAAALPRQGEPAPARARGGRRSARARDAGRARREGGRRVTSSVPASRSPTCASRCRTTRS